MIFSALVLLAELAVLFFSVAFFVQLLQRRIGDEKLRVWMGGKPLVAALKGIAVGFITPFCTYSAVPMLVGMRQAGVPSAGYVAFIMAAPVLDPVLFGALAIIVGLKVAVIYLVIAFFAALSLAILADLVDISTQLKPISIQSNGSTCTASRSQSWRGIQIEIPSAAIEAITLLRSVGLLLIIGVLVGIGITTFLSADAVASWTNHGNGLDIPIAAAIGTPIYTTTALLVPIADSLIGVGVSIGAVVALTIAGAGANLPEFILLMRFFHTAIICVFFAYVFLIAVLGGYISQMLVGYVS